MALQTMLAKLEGEEETPATAAPAAPAPPIPGNQANIVLPNSLPFRDDVAPLGKYFGSVLVRVFSSKTMILCHSW